MKRFPSYALGATLLALLILPEDASAQRGCAVAGICSIPHHSDLGGRPCPDAGGYLAHGDAAIFSRRRNWPSSLPIPDFEKKAITVKGVAETDDLGGGQSAGHYAVHFQGLDPNTRYCYRVGDGQAWSEWNIFRTASDRPEPFRFLYLGDAQNSIKSLWSRSIRAAYATVPDARFIVHAGDLLAEGYDDRLWGEWSDAMSFISAIIPSVPVPGNHDLHRPPGRRTPRRS